MVDLSIEIVDLPIENGGSFHSYVAVDQRVARSRNVSKFQYAKPCFLVIFLAKPTTTVPLQTSGKRREIG